ncbi:MAG: hypothetical protein IPL79_09505 [Myxococcales bacterium]|nr:hypothetical protein [Myxococcales bacterium]
MSTRKPTLSPVPVPTQVVSEYTPGSEPPVIARVMVEIRSDGSRTIARGAMEDLISGENVAIEARGSSLLNVALQLAGSMRSLPNLIRGRSPAAAELAPGATPGGLRKRDKIRQHATNILSKFK